RHISPTALYHFAWVLAVLSNFFAAAAAFTLTGELRTHECFCLTQTRGLTSKSCTKDDWRKHLCCS
ncbi:unnamed protein product, partial [Linum tenue]